jgi:hypothetical protein
LSEDVYFHPRFANSGVIEDGSTVRAEMVPNTPDMRERTPWMVVRLVNDVASKPSDIPVLDDEVLAVLSDYQFATTQEIAEVISANEHEVSLALHRLFGRGYCVKAPVYTGPEKEPIFVVWAAEADDLQGMMEDAA